MLRTVESEVFQRATKDLVELPMSEIEALVKVLDKYRHVLHAFLATKRKDCGKLPQDPPPT